MGKNAHHGATRRGGEVLFFKTSQLTLITDPGQPGFRPSALFPPDEKMVRDFIKVRRNRVPVHLRKDGDKLVITEGRTRYIACCEANRRLKKAGEEPIELQCLVKQHSAEQALEESFAANVIRRVAGAVEMADDIAFLTAQGKSIAEMAELCDVSPDTVKNYQKVAGCSKKVREALNAGEISLTTARDMADLASDDQDKLLGELKGKVGGAAARVVAEEKSKKLAPKPSKTKAKGHRVESGKEKPKKLVTKTPGAAKKPLPDFIPGPGMPGFDARDDEPEETETKPANGRTFVPSPKTRRSWTELCAFLSRLDPEDDRIVFRTAAAMLRWDQGDDSALDDIGAGNLARIAKGLEALSTEELLDTMPDHKQLMNGEAAEA